MSFLVDIVAIICWHKLTLPLAFVVSVPCGFALNFLINAWTKTNITLKIKLLELASRCVEQQGELIKKNI